MRFRIRGQMRNVGGCCVARWRRNCRRTNCTTMLYGRGSFLCRDCWWHPRCAQLTLYYFSSLPIEWAKSSLESRVQHAMNSWAREIHSMFDHLNENINSIYLAHLLTTKYLNILRHLKYRSLLQTIRVRNSQSSFFKRAFLLHSLSV